ncbi:DgyrCDS3191 [Dimorphilus gyrociliatus]|uniref:DgyrCDS3191 n=1 Tax=Dimorphilus gyrociliatus TaxID=2664684 RepID=A0A7I8VE91_9ANNE|nr:DgyrCDS3191 [Dimorphilus gyrociliatus]
MIYFYNYLIKILVSFISIRIIAMCTLDTDCIYDGKCINGTCKCDNPILKGSCHLGSKYLIIQEECSIESLTYFKASNLSDCIENCTSNDNCTAVTLLVNFNVLFCFLKQICSFPLSPPSNLPDRIYTVLFKDSEQSLCGHDDLSTTHIRECIEFLWNKHTHCSSNGLGLTDNMNKWLGNMTVFSIKEEMIEISKNSVHFSKVNSQTASKELYRSLCYGNLSPGRYNIAFGKKILHNMVSSSSSTIYNINHLVDGVTNPNANLGGCLQLFKSNLPTLWFAIDLKTNYIVRRVIIYPQSKQIGDLELKITVLENEPVDSINPNLIDPYQICTRNVTISSDSERKTIDCQAKLLPARYTVFFTESIDNLTICEVEIFTSDLALNGQTFTSSVKNEAYGGFAVQDATSSIGFNSRDQAENWFSVHIDGKYIIYGLDIFGIDYKKLKIYVINRNYLLDKETNDSELCNNFKNEGYFEYLFCQCKNHLIGEFIVAKSKAYLNIKNLQIWGLFQNDSSLVNIAYKKPTWQSSTYIYFFSKPYYSYYATDGQNNDKFSRTLFSFNHLWFCVDLLLMYRIDYIGIQTITSNNYNKVFSYKFKIIEKKSRINVNEKLLNSDCYTKDQASTDEIGETVVWNCSFAIKYGRYIYIDSSSQIIINELYAYGKQLEENLQVLSKVSTVDVTSNKQYHSYQHSPLKIIDGNFNNIIPTESCTLLTANGEKILKVNLDNKYHVTQIVIQPLYKLYSDVFKNVDVYVKNDTNNLQELCKKITLSGLIRNLLIIDCERPIYGNQVILIRKDNTKHLSICEIKIYEKVYLNDKEDQYNRMKIMKNTRLITDGFCLINEKVTNLINCFLLCKRKQCITFSFNLIQRLCCLSLYTELNSYFEVSYNDLIGQVYSMAPSNYNLCSSF